MRTFEGPKAQTFDFVAVRRAGPCRLPDPIHRISTRLFEVRVLLQSGELERAGELTLQKHLGPVKWAEGQIIELEREQSVL